MMASEPGSEAFGFARIDFDPASAGMGGANLASPQSVSYAAFCNVAMIPFSSSKVSADASYMKWAPASADCSGISAGASFSLGKLGVALGYLSNSYAHVDKYDPKDNMMALGLAFKLSDKLSVGVNGKYASQIFTSKQSFSGVLADVYVAGKWDSLTASAGVSSIGGKVSLNNKDEFAAPASFRLGAGYQMAISESQSVLALADIDYYFSGALSFAAGAQYGFKDMLFARAGYRYGGQSVLGSYMSLGLGVKFACIVLNANYLLASDTLGGSMSFGLGVRF